MATSITAPNASEHWLTAMRCIICNNTPNVSPLYKCSLGHVVCMTCYSKIVHRGVPRCKECNGINFKPIHVSPEFLQKLKIKPGIGRPRRYNPSPPLFVPLSKSESRTTKSPNITLEELFGLNEDQLRFLFDENIKCKNKLNYNELREFSSKHYLDRQDMGDKCIVDNYDESKIWKIKNRNKLLSVCDISTSTSRKPLTCPHSPCSKIIAQSSFNAHFKYEHCDIPRFNLDRGKELHLIHDISVISHGSSFCLGLITIYDTGVIKISAKQNNIPFAKTARKLAQRIPMCTFWLMVSASSEDRKNRTYVIYWMLSNTDDFYHCTLELSSQEENTVCSCFCTTTGIHESLDLDDVAHKMKCLYLTYGSLTHLLEEGPKLNLRITVH